MAAPVSTFVTNPGYELCLNVVNLRSGPPPFSYNLGGGGGTPDRRLECGQFGGISMKVHVAATLYTARTRHVSAE